MENLSKLTIDDSTSSMYFSFNSTAANKTVEAMESGNEMSCIIDDEDSEQNLTLEAEESAAPGEELQTVKKLSLGVSPMQAIPKNILMAYKALSSTPTKAQLLRSVEVTRGSVAVDVCDLGLAFLDAPQDRINEVLSEDKENQPQESLEINSETSSEIVVSVIEKTQEEEKPATKRVGFSNLPPLRDGSNDNVLSTPEIRHLISRSMPNMETNRPSRILPKKSSLSSKGKMQIDKEHNAENLINSMLKICKGPPMKGKQDEKAFNFIGKTTRMSIVKTTLNSPVRRPQRKSIAAVPAARNAVRQHVIPISKRKSMAPEVTPITRRSVMPAAGRKSMLPISVASPKKGIATSNSRRTVQEKRTTSMIPTPRKSMAPKTSESVVTKVQDQPENKLIKAKKHPRTLNDEFICKVCTRKFRVLSLFEAHKRSHITAATTKQNFSINDKQCRYCDKTFAIAKALAIHLIEKCTKIPPGDKKKLLFPPDQPTSAGQARTQVPLKSHSNLSSCDSLASSTAQTQSLQSSDNNDRSMLPPSVNKLKKKVAHSGVYCTPNKQIPCHVCKVSFSNILAYAEHSLSHSIDGNEISDIKTITESTQTQVELKSDATQTLQEDGIAFLN